MLMRFLIHENPEAHPDKSYCTDNDECHFPSVFAAITGTEMGAMSAPTCAPELNMLVEKALSFFGKNSAVVFIAAGKLPASPRASTKRANMNSVTLTRGHHPDVINSADYPARLLKSHEPFSGSNA